MDDKKFRAPQKLVTFECIDEDIKAIQNDMKDGWSFISLVQEGRNYIGIMEKTGMYYNNIKEENSGFVYIPPIKKLKIKF